jgi:hypothetical protein
MRVSARVLVLGLIFLSSLFLPVVVLSIRADAQQSDEAVAERILGPQWKQLSRRAGMIFAGTVLSSGTPISTPVTTTEVATVGRAQGSTQAVELNFRVDEAIAGVEQGQTLKIREWAGAWSMHPAMRSGQHILLFLYPLSRLGLTSPVGGSLGQFELDASGKNVAFASIPGASILMNESPLQPAFSTSGNSSVVQLERAIRSAREE